VANSPVHLLRLGDQCLGAESLELEDSHEVGQPVSELRNVCPVHHDVECRPRWACA
jgi:hypothetical protein